MDSKAGGGGGGSEKYFHLPSSLPNHIAISSSASPFLRSRKQVASEEGREARASWEDQWEGGRESPLALCHSPTGTGGTRTHNQRFFQHSPQKHPSDSERKEDAKLRIRMHLNTKNSDHNFLSRGRVGILLRNLQLCQQLKECEL